MSDPEDTAAARVMREIGQSLRDRLVSEADAAAARTRIADLLREIPPTQAAGERRQREERRERRRGRDQVTRRGPVSVQETSANRKLGPVELVKSAGVRLSPRGSWPFVSSTYAAIQPTCPDSCAFKGAGCYVDEGLTGWHMERMNAAAEKLTALEVIQFEARAIREMFGGGRVPQDGARGGRDMRLHVGGDVGGPEGALELAWVVDQWLRRGGGDVWTFTHWWAEIPRSHWGKISVLASCDSAGDVARAAALGYSPVLVVDKFPSHRAFSVPGWDGKLIPCPAEATGGATTCVECRLCLDGDALLERRRGIAFEVHGTGADVAAAQLVPATRLVR